MADSTDFGCLDICIGDSLSREFFQEVGTDSLMDCTVDHEQSLLSSIADW